MASGKTGAVQLAPCPAGWSACTGDVVPLGFIPLALPAPPSPVRAEPLRPSAIEIEMAGGHRLRAEAGVEVVLLQGLIATLLGR
ncbi:MULTISPECIES: hypothetical protein [Methylorubrum]|uniref:hypothetical protein n=1 Tax=Methylorubrum TaxID=2282523 RepID=UPI001477C164|nr:MULTISPECIES: hypothetical protein [Methylorubrum]MCJ2027980.1 hypothetical protein [Methylobacterium sp. J-043]MDF9861167.1 hypothetical protein [Methylorubrum pseudosasae]MDH6640003.1 hypothetical protein [Methylobacterium sp. SuP10 SLI 274]MCP1551506.1 hypothetical protein [Methylorubrum zatmanii]MCP1556443.1 hypothetical protein [Methylorubrum extorquens]